MISLAAGDRRCLRRDPEAVVILTSEPDPLSAEVEELSARADELRESGPIAEEIAVRQEVIRMVDGLERPPDSLLARNVLRLAVAMQRTGEIDAAIELLRSVSEEFAEVEMPNRPTFVADALYLRARYLLRSERWEDAVDVADELVRRFGHDKAAAERVALALVMKSQCLSPARLGRRDEALAALDELLRRYEKSDEPGLRRAVAAAMFYKAGLLQARGDAEESMRWLGEVFDQFSGDPPSNDPTVPFRAQAQKIKILLHGDRAEVAVGEADRLADCLAVHRDDGLLSAVGQSVTQVTLAFEAADLREDALRLLTATHEALLAGDDDDAQRYGIFALINAAVIAGQLGRQDEALARVQAIVETGEPALAVLDELIKRAADPDNPTQSVREPWGLLTKGAVLEQLARPQDALAAYDDLVNRFSKASATTIQTMVAAARDASLRVAEREPPA